MGSVVGERDHLSTGLEVTVMERRYLNGGRSRLQVLSVEPSLMTTVSTPRPFASKVHRDAAQT
jgi:hypothetical protein